MVTLEGYLDPHAGGERPRLMRPSTRVSRMGYMATGSGREWCLAMTAPHWSVWPLTPGAWVSITSSSLVLPGAIGANVVELRHEPKHLGRRALDDL
jgi:hypothetical protein